MIRNPRLSRRGLLRALGGAALAAPFYRLLRPGVARAYPDDAQRVIFFYFPDGVAGPSQDGEPSLWHCTGSEFDFGLSRQLEPLAAFKDDCVFLNGLSMGGTDSGSHPGGAKKLLTAVDYGNGESIDQVLARTAGASMPWRHLYLGAMANMNNASGDKHISYPSAGQSITPEDNPRRAFELIFGSAVPAGDGGEVVEDTTRASVIDGVLDELTHLKTELGGAEAAKLDLHLEAVREVEQRLQGTTGGVVDAASCEEPRIDTGAFDDSQLYEQSLFPEILRAQIDLMVLAMSCGVTKVGTIQASQHTSELIMSRFPGTEMYDPGYDMRSHQASHYGASHNEASREFTSYVAQRRWWVSQLAYLLEQLDARPERDGTMLDYSLVVLCTEVCDGNTHLHDNMPFVLAGRAGGRLSTGRLLDYGYQRHSDLWISVAHAMGEPLTWFGEASSGPLWGLV
ncbi:MAG: DUF1552 domain-containing protein [Alphaproteobacteria bacterium]|nr:DUF1552 domain-containing protein [Alphaproteobacteria bacterium]